MPRFVFRGSMHTCAAIACIVGASYAIAQDAANPAGARELYYFARSSKDELPRVRKVGQTKSPPFGAMHLGLRYSLLLVDDAGHATPMASDRVLRTGECFAVEFEANRSGYLYVLAKQSSGAWMPLLPSLKMSEENNIIDPGKKFRVPEHHCFAIENPPGTETLFVVLSRDPRDFYELYEGIKGKATPLPAAPGPNPPSRPEPLMQVADARMVNDAVAQLADRFGSRDLAIRKVAEPAGKTEPRDSVYVVNASAKPVSSIVTQIEVRHR